MDLKGLGNAEPSVGRWPLAQEASTNRHYIGTDRRTDRQNGS